MSSEALANWRPPCPINVCRTEGLNSTGYHVPLPLRAGLSCFGGVCFSGLWAHCAGLCMAPVENKSPGHSYSDNTPGDDRHQSYASMGHLPNWRKRGRKVAGRGQTDCSVFRVNACLPFWLGEGFLHWCAWRG